MTKGEIDSLFEKLINKYGALQIIIAIEELSELQKELCKSLRGKEKRENLIEEMADTYIMIEQMKIWHNITDEEIDKKIYEKLERTKRRCFSNENTNKI